MHFSLSILCLVVATVGSGKVVPTVNPEHNPCPEDWFHHGKRCYLWSGTDSKENWFKAELDCRKKGGHIVSLDTEEETKAVRGFTSCDNAHWIGLVNVEFEGNTFMDLDSWVWWDGHTHNYTQFKPVNTAGYYCGYATAEGNWTNNFCSHVSMPWVCERPENKRDGKLLPRPEVICPAGWVERNAECFWFSNHTANYFHAQLTCEEMGGHVATIDNRFEQAFLQAFMGCDRPFWIGLVKAKPCLSEKNNKGCWEWSDLRPMLYDNWKNFDPSSKTVECVYSQGYWDNDIPCDNLMPFVCKKHSK